MTTRKRIITFSLFLVLTLVAGVIGSYLMLGRARIVTLESNPISDAVEKSLESESGVSYKLIEGKDYIVNDIKYFSEKKWAVVSIEPTSESFDSAIVVLTREGGDYKVVLGPGTSFSDSSLESLPNEVANYIKR